MAALKSKFIRPTCLTS